MSQNPLRAVGYRRVSMREQVDGHSLDAQERNITDYVRSQGWVLVEIYTDAGISAKKDSHRPAHEQMMADARSGKFDVIVVDKIDRFYRHLAGLLTALDDLRSINVSFASVQERLDFSSPWGKLMLTVLGILAEIYLDNLRGETIKGKRQRAIKGLWNGLPPYGYCRGLCSQCSEPNGSGYCPDFGSVDKTDGKHLILHPIDSEIVKLVYSWYKTGNESDRSIADRLNKYQFLLPNGTYITPRAQGHPGVSLPGPFKRDIIRDMLVRVFYTGQLPYLMSRSLGARRTLRSQRSSSALYRGQHPAIIRQDDFDYIQELRKTLGNNSRSKAGTTSRVFPLSGIMMCGYCGKSLRGDSSQSRRYYRDSSRIDQASNCQQPTVRADDIETDVVTVVKQHIYFSPQSSQSKEVSEKDVDLRARYERAKELYLQGDISKEEFQAAKTLFEGARKEVDIPDEADLKALATSLQSEFSNWDQYEPVKQKRLLRRVVKTIFLRGTQVVAIQPTPECSPLFHEKCCICGEGGRRSKSDNLALFDQSVTDSAAVATFSDMQGKT